MNLPTIPRVGIPTQWIRFLHDVLITHLRVNRGVTGRRTMTTTERTAVDKANGDSVYDSTLSKNMFVEGDAWVSYPANTTATYTPSNVTTDRTFDANSTSIDELADVLGTLIADLQSSGLIQ